MHDECNRVTRCPRYFEVVGNAQVRNDIGHGLLISNIWSFPPFPDVPPHREPSLICIQRFTLLINIERVVCEVAIAARDTAAIRYTVALGAQARYRY